MIDTPIAADYRGRTRDPFWEKELLDWLRDQDEQVRYEFLFDFLNYQVIVGLQLAHKSLQSRASFIKLLEYSVSNCDASTIRHWLDCIVPRLGFRRASENLERLAAKEQDGVSKALYWLSRYAKTEQDRESLNRVKQAIHG